MSKNSMNNKVNPGHGNAADSDIVNESDVHVVDVETLMAAASNSNHREEEELVINSSDISKYNNNITHSEAQPLLQNQGQGLQARDSNVSVTEEFNSNATKKTGSTVPKSSSSSSVVTDASSKKSFASTFPLFSRMFSVSGISGMRLRQKLYLLFTIAIAIFTVYMRCTNKAWSGKDILYTIFAMTLVFLYPEKPKSEATAKPNVNKVSTIENTTTSTELKSITSATNTNAADNINSLTLLPHGATITSKTNTATTAGASSNPTNTLTATEPSLPKPKPPSAPKVRLLYLDNLKNILTLCVVIYHINIGFGAAGWLPFTLSIGNFHEGYRTATISITEVETDPKMPQKLKKIKDVEVDLVDPTPTNWFTRILTWFNLVQQSYFMCLFFFISGYFTPSSLQRKGVKEFLKDKFRRFGIPLLVGCYFFFPLTTFYTSIAAFNDQGLYSGSPILDNPSQPKTSKTVMPKENNNIFSLYTYWLRLGQGPLWFIQVLLMFNLAFCWICPNGMKDLPGDEKMTVKIKQSESVSESNLYDINTNEESEKYREIEIPNPNRIPLPGFAEALVIGTLLGALQWFFFSYDFQFWETPVLAAGGGLVFDILFFFSGAIAKKNMWLEEILAWTNNTAETNQNNNNSNVKSFNPFPRILCFRIHSIIMIVITFLFTVTPPYQIIFGPNFDSENYLPSSMNLGGLIGIDGNDKSDPNNEANVEKKKKLLELLNAKESLQTIYRNPTVAKYTVPQIPLVGPKHDRCVALQNSMIVGQGGTKKMVLGNNGNNSFVKDTLVPQLLDYNSLFWNLFRGQMTLTISFTLIQIFSQYFNIDTSKTHPKYTWIFKSLASEAAYGCYVFHSVVWPAVFWLVLATVYRGMESGRYPNFKHCGKMMVAADDKEVSQSTLIVCWICTVLGSNAILWPLAILVRRGIPGMDQVL